MTKFSTRRPAHPARAGRDPYARAAERAAAQWARARRRIKTAEQYLRMRDDGNRYELLDGDLVLVPAPDTKHQMILFWLARILAAHVEARSLGQVFIAPFDVHLGKLSVCQPDVLFLARERKRLLNRKNLKGAPDLAVEIASPSRRKYDRVTKRGIYERAGVRHLWLIDGEEETVEELILEGDCFQAAAHLAGRKGTFTPKVFPKLKISLRELFRQGDDLEDEP